MDSMVAAGSLKIEGTPGLSRLFFFFFPFFF